MDIDRRQLMTLGAGAACSGLLPRVSFAAGGSAPTVADNGLFTQKWFFESFLELGDDLAAAAAQGKHLAVLIEQRGCPYCREMHRVNFAKKTIHSYITKNFEVIQMDMWGSRKVKDFDGKELSEKALVQRWKVIFTPTMVFFPNNPSEVKGKIGGAAAIATMPGYFKPFHFLSMLEYVHEGHYKTQNFQRYIQVKFKTLQDQGKKPTVW